MAKLTTDLLKNAVPEKGKRLELRDDKEPGLIFRVTESGQRTWSVRYRNTAKQQRRKAIGPFPSISLSKARQEAQRIKGSVAIGDDVVAQEQALKLAEQRKRLQTVAGLAEAYFADAAIGLHRANAKGPKRPGTLQLETGIFSRLVKPMFGKTAVADLRRGEIQTFISKQAKKVPSNGRHSRDILRQILSYAVWKDVLDYNPATAIGVIKSKPRERILSDHELRAIWHACSRPAEVEGLQLSLEMGMALQFALVTLQRGGEVVGAERSEIDRRARTWLIPAARMKGKRPHLVPLSDLAIALLDGIDQLSGNSRFMFPAHADDDDQHHMDRRSFSRAMKRIVEALKIPSATPHDFRRTGATNLTSERIGIPRFIVSQVIGHAGDTGGAAAVTGQHYDLNDYLPEKRRALDAWAQLLQDIVASKG